jgi:hypothetical protein
MMITYNMYIQNILYNEICIKYDYQVINFRRNTNKIVALLHAIYLNYVARIILTSLFCINLHITCYLVYRSKLILYMISHVGIWLI